MQTTNSLLMARSLPTTSNGV